MAPIEKIYYRLICNGRGIYCQVNIDCPDDSKLRENKPDGKWLPDVGGDYPGAISFFTELGLKRYREHDISKWHNLVLKSDVKIIKASNPKNIIYKDELQIILMPNDISCEPIESDTQQ